jgi:hypothetical protein
MLIKILRPTKNDAKAIPMMMIIIIIKAKGIRITHDIPRTDSGDNR